MTSALPEVLEKLERLDSGRWEEHPAMDYSICLPDGSYIDLCRTHGRPESAERDAIVAAVNFLREHGHALLRDAGGGAKDSARLDWLCSGDLKMVEESPARCFRVYRDIAPPENPHAQWHAFTEAVFPSAREAIDAAMHAPGGAG